MKEYVIEHLDQIFSYVFGAGGLFSAWREHKKTKTDALSRMQAAYDKYVEDSDQKFEDMKLEVSTLKKQLEKVEAYWKQKYSSLKKEFDTYKTTHP